MLVEARPRLTPLEAKPVQSPPSVAAAMAAPLLLAAPTPLLVPAATAAAAVAAAAAAAAAAIAPTLVAADAALELPMLPRGAGAEGEQPAEGEWVCSLPPVDSLRPIARPAPTEADGTREPAAPPC